MDDISISGHVSAGFEPVRDAFAQNFKDGLEAGAGFCVLKDGEFIVDLIGGTTDKQKQIAWTQNTLVPVFSTTKIIAALVIVWLVENDRLDYDQTVASLWPSFAAHGKGDLTIAQILSHQAGLSGITEPMEPEDWFDWDGICAKLAAQKPIWEPGTASGYHAFTYGFLVGEIARLADNTHRTLGTILREDLCAPNAIDFMIGTPESEHDRTAYLHKPRGFPKMGEINPATKAAFLEKWSNPGGRGGAAWRIAEFAAANGHGTAKSLARLMQLGVDGHIGDTKYLSQNTIDKFSKPRISGPNLVLPFEITFAAGPMLSAPNHFYGPNDTAIGHSGWGGSCAFADPDAGLSCAYVMNKQDKYLLGDPRPLRLIKALYKCL